MDTIVLDGLVFNLVFAALGPVMNSPGGSTR